MERWPITKVLPYPRNARTHSKEQIALIAQSIQRFGFTAPVLVDEDGVLIYGHGRIEAAKTLDITEIPVCVAVGWPEADKAAYRIADNQIALRSGWDQAQLTAEFRELELADYNLDLLGFEEGQLSSLMLLDPEQGLNDPNEHWQGMPSYKQGDQTAFRTFVVHVADQAAAEDFAKLFRDQPFTDKTKTLWYPAPRDPRDVRDEAWVSDK